jgi:hypothetical protein
MLPFKVGLVRQIIFNPFKIMLQILAHSPGAPDRSWWNYLSCNILNLLPFSQAYRPVAKQ